MERPSKFAAPSQVVLAVLAVIGALYLLRMILIPIAVSLVLACMFSPLIGFFRKRFPFGPLGAVSVVLLIITGGLYLASLAAENLFRAAMALPGDVERLAGKMSSLVNDLVRDQPYLRGLLPDPATIDRLGDSNSAMLIEKLSYGFSDFTFFVAQGFIVLVLTIFLLVESPMLVTKVIRFFAKTTGEEKKASDMLAQVTRKIQEFLLARAIINLGLGLVVAAGLWLLNVRFALALGMIAALMNFIPYVGQVIGGGLPALIAVGQSGSIGDGLIVVALYLAVVGIEGYVVTPYVMGRSLDLNGTTVLIACLFWGYLWGLVGLVLAMPITVSVKLVFQSVPELNKWAELMSVDWQSPDADAPADVLGGSLLPVPDEVVRPLAPGPAQPVSGSKPGTVADRL